MQINLIHFSFISFNFSIQINKIVFYSTNVGIERVVHIASNVLFIHPFPSLALLHTPFPSPFLPILSYTHPSLPFPCSLTSSVALGASGIPCISHCSHIVVPPTITKKQKTELLSFPFVHCCIASCGGKK